MKKISLVLLCIWYINTYAQEESFTTPTPIQTPSSPEIASILRYGEIPISHFSGVPNISVPIHTVQERDLTVPISISYHAGGIKVEDIASEVGLGWSLNAGGLITRSKNGLPDESPFGYHYAATVDSIYPVNTSTLSHRLNKYDDYDMMNKIAIGDWDLQPDVFSFSIFGKYSGKFIIKYDGTIVTLPSSQVKIIPPVSLKENDGNRYDAADDEWLIITTDGSRFYFGGSNYQELTDVILTDGNESYISGWFLRKVVTPTLQEAEFSYDQETIDYDAKNSTTVFTKITQSGSCGRANQTAFSNSLVTTRKISTIQTSSHRITFFRESRDDLHNGRRLKGIKIEKLTSDWRVLRYFKLHNNSYFGSQLNNNLRLRLNSISEFPNLNHPDSLSHLFTYDESIEMPSRSSFARDFWGYYNGATSNLMLVPEMEFNGELLTGADRSVSEEHAKAYLLEQVNYPTGGYTIFDYESNQYYNDEPYYTPNNKQIIKSNAPVDIDPIQSIGFSLSHQQHITVDAKITFDSGVPVGDRTGAWVRINDNVGNVVFEEGNKDIDDEYLISLSQGSYTLEIYNTDAAGTDFDAKVDYQKDLGLHPKKYLVGGVRIKKQTSYSLKGDPLTTSYFYNPYNVTVFNDPAPSGYTYTLCEPKPDAPTDCECSYLVRTASSRFFANSQSVGYKEVHEVKGELIESECFDNPLISLNYTFCESVNGNLGKTIYTFHSTADLGAGGWPFTPRRVQSWKQGISIKNAILNSNGDSLNQIGSTYQFPQIKTVSGLVIGKVKAPPATQFDNLVVSTEFTQASYTYSSEIPQLVYKRNELQGVVSDEYFAYDDKWYQLEEHTTISSGDTILKKMRYVTDLEPVGNNGEFRTANFIGEPIEITTKKNGEITSSHFKDYELLVINDSSFQIELRALKQYNLEDNSLNQPIAIDDGYVIDDGYSEVLKIDHVFIPSDKRYFPTQFENTSLIKSFFLTDRNQVLAVFNQASDRTQVKFLSFEFNQTDQVYNTISGGTSAESYQGNISFSGILEISVSEPKSSNCNISFFAKGSNLQINGVDIPLDSDWKHYNITIPWAQAFNINTNGGHIDAISVYPKESSVQTFEHGHHGVIRSTDTNGVSNFFTYDDFGRLIEVKDNDGNILKKHQYQYANDQN